MAQDLDTLKHSAAHALAMAAIRLFPDTKIGVGPVTDEGYYYDFEFPKPISPEDLRHIEAEMNLIIQSNLPFQQIVVSREEGFDILLKRGQIYKAELLREIADPEVSFYRTGEEFIDLCRGPHVNVTSEIGVVKLTGISHVNWKNDSTRPGLQRIYGVAFPTLEELQEYLSQQSEIANRDFRSLAKHTQLTLGGQSEVIYTPGGTVAFRQIEQLITGTLTSQKFAEVLTSPASMIPETEKYLDSYYSYKNRSYKELPIRIFTHNRHELDSAIKITGRDYNSITTIVAKSYFSSAEKLIEFQNGLQTITTVLDKLSINYAAQIHIPGLDYDLTTYISEGLQRKGIAQTQIINPYLTGAELELIVKDSLGRKWTLATLSWQESSYQFVSKIGDMVPTQTITITWILDTLLAYFLEEKEGMLPIWLAPTQVVIIPISEQQYDYSEHIYNLLSENGLRVHLDNRSDTMQSRIRQAEILKIPVIMIIGEKEMQNKSVSIRQRNQREVGLVGEDVLVNTIHELAKE